MTDTEQKRVFAQNLKRLLNERNLTQNEVAKAINVSPQTFNTW
jgi:DNA-binding helix-turn-helix protein